MTELSPDRYLAVLHTVDQRSRIGMPASNIHLLGNCLPHSNAGRRADSTFQQYCCMADILSASPTLPTAAIAYNRNNKRQCQQTSTYSRRTTTQMMI